MDTSNGISQSSDARSAELLRALPVACALMNDHLEVMECNQAMIELLAKKPGEPFYFVDEKTNIEYKCDGNCQSCEKLNRDDCTAKECLLKNWLRTVTTSGTTPKKAMNARRHLANMSLEKGKYTFTIDRVTLYGEPFFSETTAIPLTYDGEQYFALMIEDKRDSVLRKQAEDESRAKSRFLARMSHEIRTPMNAVLGITEIQLQKGSHPPDTEEAFLRIYRSSSMLLAIINDILDFSKAEAGKIQIVSAVYETSSLIIDSVQINLMHIGSKNIDLVLDISENLPIHLVGDKLRIKQILNNLLSNAFKYTHEGSVKLSLSCEKRQPDGQVMLVITVNDTGQGMSESELNTIKSTEYTRFNLQQNYNVEGSGLGMSITYHLIHLMSGELIASSKPGVGTTFTARIPQKLHDNEVLGPELAANLRNLESVLNSFKRVAVTKREPMPYGSVLIVDDVESNLFVAKGMMMPYKLKIETVMSGVAAIELIKQGNVYDIIFMDHMMPDMDGIEVTRELRELGYNEPIVALTANIVMDQAKLFLENGFSDFVSKPIDASRLEQCLVRFIKDKQPSEVLDAVKQMGIIVEKQKSSISEQLVNSFVRDSNREIDVLKNLMKANDWSEKNLKLYTISTHAMKSALANIDMAELSGIAYQLEQAGRAKNLDAILAKTPEFIQKLQETANSHKLQNDENFDVQIDEDVLREHFGLLADACDNYNKSDAKKALKTISALKVTRKIKEVADEISVDLLHSEFEIAAEKARKAI